MSEGGAVGPVEREALDRVRERIIALRRDQYRLLEDLADLQRLGVARQTGDRFTERLLQELGRLNRRDADRLVDETADLVPQLALSGQPLPARLPATATVFAAGEIGPDHVVIIRRTMGRIDTLEHFDPVVRSESEATLAEGATRLSPDALTRLAARVLAYLDPDGAAPDEREERDDELLISSRRDGSLRMTATFRGAMNAEIVREGFAAASTPAGPDDDRKLENRQAAALTEFVLGAQGPGGLLANDQPVEPEPEPEVEPEVENALIPAPRRPEPPAALRRQAPRALGRPLLTITMDHRWLQQAIGHGTLDSGALVDAATVRRWACDAEIIPLVLGSKSEPLDVGRLARTATDAIRRALNLRDGGCVFPGCTRPPRRCHAHHIAMPLSYEVPFTCVPSLACRGRFLGIRS
ncbi:MAG: hypothetical protein AVDCRST_MAG54-2856 [uncultured Actinomycetospora sp.]|uniref:DUF222 domain-containing protein n=1 Tax=uncultured Actinomycetospora sp. TaxID=1135996 RepID=A0A6J4J471_9PSEU|nr:MAG: hypothetical protein AVDCRST_MAG54-2856 [uncultured Actinomycetospora sp.]